MENNEYIPQIKQTEANRNALSGQILDLEDQLQQLKRQRDIQTGRIMLLSELSHNRQREILNMETEKLKLLGKNKENLSADLSQKSNQ